MANGDNQSSGNPRSILAGVGIGSLVAGAVLIVNLARDVPSTTEVQAVRGNVTIALEAIGRHADEFKAIRKDLSTLRGEVSAKLESSTRDRFYAKEWEIHDRRIEEKFSELEKVLDRHEGQISQGILPEARQRLDYLERQMQERGICE